MHYTSVELWPINESQKNSSTSEDLTESRWGGPVNLLNYKNFKKAHEWVHYCLHIEFGGRVHGWGSLLGRTAKLQDAHMWWGGGSGHSSAASYLSCKPVCPFLQVLGLDMSALKISHLHSSDKSADLHFPPWLSWVCLLRFYFGFCTSDVIICLKLSHMYVHINSKICQSLLTLPVS